MCATTETGCRPAGRRVLVVDGNPDAAESLAVLLRLHGHHAVTAPTGPEALAAARSLRPDAVFLSIVIPGTNGYDLARQLRTEPAGGPPPTPVAQTAVAREEDREQARQAGFDHHLAKPADPAAVLALLDSLPPTGAPE